MTTYAIPQTVPDDCDYLTAGRRYQTWIQCPVSFDFIGDDGRLRYALWEDSGHLNGGNWTRVEGDEE